MGDEVGGADEFEEFGSAAIGQLEKLLHVEFGDKLKSELDKLTSKFRPVAISVPSKLTSASSKRDLSKQIQWFEDNTIKPAKTLLIALTVDRRQMRTAMSPDFDSWIDTEHLIPLLEKLLDDADAVYVEMDHQMAQGITNREQLQYEVVSALYEIFDRNLGSDFTHRGVTTVDEVLRVACGVVLSHQEQINSVLKAVRLQASKC